ncbi:MAG: hypothetical protein IJV91_08755 [Kiritimatiellae bacterium]|nr:hypothetical protein [Kiritimatiellia bacterium]
MNAIILNSFSASRPQQPIVSATSATEMFLHPCSVMNLPSTLDGGGIYTADAFAMRYESRLYEKEYRA